ncbi:tetratricopeptide repeat protein [Salidesulfovibrio onnuriiensis]|uniref:tetratricopeptide repeat protein n=1 Tax=Salidesulfovibrio onnuriiensis TaxID=2583823 RepID=UPI0011CB5C05|nr:tetratricopeptide repeat protein [Salidesulfovibrio onnuriiensis]
MNRFTIALLAALLLCCAACGSETEDSVNLSAARDSYSKGFYLEAETGYERYLQLNPQGEFRKEAWERLLEISLNIKGDLERSVALLDAMALELGDDKAEAWRVLYRLGDIYDQMGKRQKSIEAFEKCLILAIDMPAETVKTQLRMARVYRSLGNYDLVMDTLQNCSRNAENDAARAQCLYELAQSCSLINNWNMVKKSIEELLTLNGVDPETRAMATFLLAEAYEDEHRYAEAVSLLKSILDTYPNPMVVEARLKALAAIKPQ